MASPDAPWGFSDLGNSVDDELVASAETATEAYPDGAGGQEDSVSSLYSGRDYGYSGKIRYFPYARYASYNPLWYAPRLL
jgi:hypothetical protein